MKNQTKKDIMFLIATIVIISLLYISTGCTTTDRQGEYIREVVTSPITRAGIQLATLTMIKHQDDPVETAREVIAIMQLAKKSLDPQTELTLSMIHSETAKVIKWDKLEPEMIIVARGLLEAIEAEIEKRIHGDILQPEDRLYAVDLINAVIEVAELYL